MGARRARGRGPGRTVGGWDPGAIDDRALAALFTKAQLSRARRAFDAGFVAELVRSAKPTAQLFQPACTLRFLVPGDPRYTYCDCADEAPCRHVPLAVWAFRRLAAEATAGWVQTARDAYTVPAALLADVQDGLLDAVELGIAGASERFVRRLCRLAERLRAEGLRWPAGIMDEMLEEHARYRDGDATFDPIDGSSSRVSS